MRYYLDKQLQGHAMIFDGPLQILDGSIKANQGMTKGSGYSSFPMKAGEQTNPNTNRTFTSWQEVRDCFTKSSNDTAIIQKMVEEMKREIPIPLSIKRQPGWSESAGNIDVDRAMRGDLEIYRTVRRQSTIGPVNIALLCNLDAVWTTSHTDLFWRGAAAIAVADILEDAGYNVEIWMWNHGYSVYPGKNGGQFTSCNLKQAGEVIDMNAMAHALSGWFLRLGVFGSFATCPVKPNSCGGMCYDLGEWRKYMEVSEGIREFGMPIVKAKKPAVEAATKILDEIATEKYLEDKP